jgi:hypothetical protein
VKPEPESPSIWRFLGKAKLASSELLVTEVPRALRGAPEQRGFNLLRSLDAIHVMTALEIRPIEVFLSYDLRQLEAARDAGLPTVSPGMKR